MNLGQLIGRVRRQLPAATQESVPDFDITTELNIGVDEVNRRAQAYKGYTEFNLVPEQQIYSLATVCPNYLGITKDGVWWQDASATFKYRIAKTIRWLDTNLPNWRDATSGVPFWYWIQGDELGFYVKPSTAWKCRIYHLKKATPMDNNSNYPWSNTTSEVTALQGFDEAIVAYAIWKLAPAVGKDQKETPEEALFLRSITTGMQQVRRRPDLMADVDSYQRLDSSLT